MRKLFVTMILAAGSLMYKNAEAQVGVSVGFNIGPVSVQLHKPAAVVYDDFYYMPDVEAYYSVPENVYYYMDGDEWISAPCLPGAYRDYNWRNVRHYEVRAERPFRNHDYYRSRFGGFDRNSNRGYAYRMPQGGNRGRFNGYPQSPYDSNNDRGRGGYYNRPDMRNYPNRGNWNNSDRGRGDYNRPDNDNRGRGGFDRSDNYNRDNGRGNYGRPENGNQGRGGFGNGQGGYNRPSNNQPNRGDNSQQRFTNNGPTGRANRMMF
ncbi:hypothetical protein KHS38_01880 [Mucilaginibacter sp. Bleaf8]|uniref:hypothetical protein n=1 Tax=Mucilaginibacter sp. Bleaf8 TaxID=2834430 RepID=UPI001BCCB66B|nr:hypothetical protein [Mucilaginibacter sp. Bleaf8]MBS7563142.1 hypothetical protein [Mucilaginibacter sp. Bleaf8]